MVPSALRGLEICVSSTSFQKNIIGWPQQPLTEKVQKFNMILHDSTTQSTFSQNMKIKLIQMVGYTDYGHPMKA